MKLHSSRKLQGRRRRGKVAKKTVDHNYYTEYESVPTFFFRMQRNYTYSHSIPLWHSPRFFFLFPNFETLKGGQNKTIYPNRVDQCVFDPFQFRTEKNIYTDDDD